MSQVPALRQTDFWGNPIESKTDTDPCVIPAIFDESTVRMFIIKGEPWWVAADVCKVLGLTNIARAISSLDEDEKNTLTLGKGIRGNPNHSIISESGLFALVFKSRKNEARRFRKWVTSEVLPQIRKTGTYSIQETRIVKEIRRLKSNEATAKARCDQFRINLRQNRTLADSGAVPNDFKAFWNAIYRGQFDADAPTLRKMLGIRSWDTPLDHMGYLPLSANHHIKAVVELRIAELGPGVPMKAKVKLAEQIARQMTEADMQLLGPGYYVGRMIDPHRGAIIDVIRNQLASPEQPRAIR